MDYTTTATRQNNNQNQRTNLCKVITKKAIREFLPNTERGRDILVLVFDQQPETTYVAMVDRGEKVLFQGSQGSLDMYTLHEVNTKVIAQARTLLRT